MWRLQGTKKRRAPIRWRLFVHLHIPNLVVLWICCSVHQWSNQTKRSLYLIKFTKLNPPNQSFIVKLIFKVSSSTSNWFISSSHRHHISPPSFPPSLPHIIQIWDLSLSFLLIWTTCAGGYSLPFFFHPSLSLFLSLRRTALTQAGPAADTSASPQPGREEVKEEEGGRRVK